MLLKLNIRNWGVKNCVKVEYPSTPGSVTGSGVFFHQCPCSTFSSRQNVSPSQIVVTAGLFIIMKNLTCLYPDSVFPIS